MNQHAKVYMIPMRSLGPVLRGEKRIVNLPADAETVAFDYGLMGVGIRVHSQCFPEVPFGQPLPLVPAVLERRP